MPDDWQRLDATVTILTTAASWPLACEALQQLVKPEATVYRLSHRGRKLTGSPGDPGLWLSHVPLLRQALIDQTPLLLPDGPCPGWWLPWAGGALHIGPTGDTPPRWLLSVAHLLSRFQDLPAADTAHGEDVKTLRQLNELSWLIHGTKDLTTLLSLVPEQLGRHLGLTHCAIIRLGPDDQVAEVIGAWELGAVAPVWASLRCERHSPLGEALAVIGAGRWRSLDPADPTLRVGRAAHLFAHGDTVVAPLVADGERWGLLVTRHPRPRSLKLGRLLVAIAEHVTRALVLRWREARQQVHLQLTESLYQHFPVPIALLDGDGCVIRCNPAAEALLGPLTIENRPFYQLVAAPDRQRLQDAWLDLDSGRPIQVIHARLVGGHHPSQGRDVVCSLSGLPRLEHAASTSPHTVLTLQDYSSTSRRLRENDHRLRLWESLAQGLSESLAIVGSDHQLIWASPPIHGDLHAASCCHPLFQDPSGGACLAEQAVQHGITRHLSGGNEASAGMAVHVWPVLAPDRTILGAVATAAARMPQSTPDEAVWSVIGRLLDGVRHDLNNPLSVILGRTESLRIDGIQSPHVDAIERAVQRQTDILQALATWRPRPGPADIINLVEAAQATLEALQTVSKGFTQGWTVVATDEPVLVRAQNHQIRALLTSLFVWPGRPRGPRTLVLQIHPVAETILLTIGGWDPAQGPAWVGKDLLMSLGGQVDQDPETLRPVWRLPRWPAALTHPVARPT